ncbi:YihY/virulence factor BrkB family protein [Pontibacter harenae]|uniref:YihY/virulence factor BrkB family protein n=1 Tax=Pontibacter harenae TaxID=2894083 RepID=UPI001E442F22|nr:YihY/virulence factor BrkB family protein [Pontibacter harenae]MCC9166422.1 YihY/virulence factor BrkB family protein [Pontibacter harenae]
MAASKTSKTISILKSTFSEFSDNNCMLLAAALAFNAIFSIPPLLVIIVRAVSFFFREQVVSGELSATISNAVGPSAAQSVEDILHNAQMSDTGGIAFWIGLGTLIFASTTFFATLQQSLNTVWNLKPKPTNGILKMLQVRLFSFGIVLSMAFLMLLSLVISTVVSILSEYITDMIPDISMFLIWLIDFTISVGIITILFALIFKYLPDAIIRWRDVWIGALITALLFVIGKFLISWFIGTSDPGSAYGAAGSIVILLIWIYYSSVIVLIGAELTQQYSTTFGHRILPKAHAVFYKEQEVPVHPKQAIDREATGRPPSEGRFNNEEG